MGKEHCAVWSFMRDYIRERTSNVEGWYSQWEYVWGAVTVKIRHTAALLKEIQADPLEK